MRGNLLRKGVSHDAPPPNMKLVCSVIHMHACTATTPSHHVSIPSAGAGIHGAKPTLTNDITQLVVVKEFPLHRCRGLGTTCSGISTRSDMKYVTQNVCIYMYVHVCVRVCTVLKVGYPGVLFIFVHVFVLFGCGVLGLGFLFLYN